MKSVFQIRSFFFEFEGGVSRPIRNRTFIIITCGIQIADIVIGSIKNIFFFFFIFGLGLFFQHGHLPVIFCVGFKLGEEFAYCKMALFQLLCGNLFAMYRGCEQPAKRQCMEGLIAFFEWNLIGLAKPAHE